MEHKEWYTDKIIKLRKINFYFYFLNYVIVCSVCCANLLQLCLTLRDAMDYSPPGSSAHGFSQARILERVAISSSRWSSWLTMNLLFLHLLHWQVILYHLGSPRAPISSVQSLSLVQLFATPWTAARQASLSITNSQVHQTHVHWVGDAIQPSHPLSSPSPPALNLFQHQGLFQWVSSSDQVAKVLEFQLQHQSFQWTPRTDLL